MSLDWGIRYRLYGRSRSGFIILLKESARNGSQMFWCLLKIQANHLLFCMACGNSDAMVCVVATAVKLNVGWISVRLVTKPPYRWEQMKLRVLRMGLIFIFRYQNSGQIHDYSKIEQFLQKCCRIKIFVNYSNKYKLNLRRNWYQIKSGESNIFSTNSE
jgi:hypothetical protein